MSKTLKLQRRFTSTPPPKDFTWNEFVTLIESLGFATFPSHRGYRFVDERGRTIYLHRPKRNPPTLLVCYITGIVTRLTEWGLLK